MSFGRTSTNLVESYFTDRATFYAALASPSRSWRGRLIQWWWGPLTKYRELAFASAGPLSGVKVLDAGCGAGDVALHCATMGASVTALDLSPAMLEVARCRAVSASLASSIRFVHDDLGTWKPTIDDRFDLALAIAVFDYSAEPDLWLSQIASTSARIFATFPAQGSISSVVRRMHYALVGGIFCRFYRRDELIKLYDKVGFRIVKFHSMPGTFWIEATSMRDE